METVDHLGPCDVADVTDGILNDVVVNKEVPIIIKQTVGDKTVFAVLARNKDMRIACAGCFKRDMKITDSTRCKKCASFIKHWDLKDGVRRDQCKDANVFDESSRVVMDFDCSSNPTVIASVDTSDLIEELKKRGEMQTVLEQMCDDDLGSVMMAVGVKPVHEARPATLIHELRRQVRGVSVQTCYNDPKKRGLPHSSDEVGADVKEMDMTRETRQSKKRKFVTTRFMPKSVTDYSQTDHSQLIKSV